MHRFNSYQYQVSFLDNCKKLRESSGQPFASCFMYFSLPTKKNTPSAKIALLPTQGPAFLI